MSKLINHKSESKNAQSRKSATAAGAVQSAGVTKLTDAQSRVLSDAAQREDGCAARLAKLTETAAQKLALALVEKKLVREVKAKSGTPIWRRDEDGREFALIITKLGRSAIAGENIGKLAEVSVDAPLSIAADCAGPAGAGSKAPRLGSKLARVIELLERDQGAGIEELTSATQWLPHTARAALTGLRKRGFAIERASAERESLYRIVGRGKALTAA